MQESRPGSFSTANDWTNPVSPLHHPTLKIPFIFSRPAEYSTHGSSNALPSRSELDEKSRLHHISSNPKSIMIRQLILLVLAASTSAAVEANKVALLRTPDDGIQPQAATDV